MQKVYLLLRSNQQTGPYSLQELLQLGLKPDDLLWIEGKSVGWFYPSELEDLKPYLNPSNKATTAPNPAPQQRSGYTAKPASNKKIFVSLPNKKDQPVAAAQPHIPADNLEQKAEELRKRILSSAAARTTLEDYARTTSYPHPYDDLEQTNAAPVYTNKTKRPQGVTAKNGAIAIVVIMLLIVGIVIWRQTPDTTLKATNEAIPQQVVPAEEMPAETGSSPLASSETPDNMSTIAEKKAVHKMGYSTIHPSAHNSSNVSRSNPVNNKASEPIVDDKVIQNTTPPPANNPTTNNAEVAVNSKDDKKAPAPEKKKSLGKRIDDFLDQFKRKDEAETTTGTQEESTNKSGTSERRSVHRDDAAANDAGETANLASLVDITANEAANNWMMGIRGLKITLRNRSNETIKTASVEVRYYGEQNQLLQKKVVTFTNIPPKQSATVPAPDHSLADHTDYQLLSIND